ncbi:MAG: hypothetical protein ACYC6Y_22510 [Thermoguttaceae bacterium]
MSDMAVIQSGKVSTGPAPFAGRIDEALEWLGERLNPILVKETRQALKSRQFLLTFSLLLIAAWGWSLIGLVMMEVDGGYGEAGPGMFMGYYAILAAAIGVFVPFGAFRSLASEQEERTYELLSITNLGPRQIVSGKLGSAVVQIVIYMSAIAPCLAFTYMLRGISLPMILLVVTCTVLGSLGLSVVGLMAGTLTAEKHWQVLLSVLLIVGLLFVFFSATGITAQIAFSSNLPFDSKEFWLSMGGMFNAYVTYFALVFYAAVAQITFVSDNRSTRLRIVMLIQHACLAAWFGGLFLKVESLEEALLYILVSFGALHWTVMGALMTGEWPELSMRVKRGLPQSFLGRAFLTWFNPGPGTGYIFACCGAIAVGLTAALLLAAGMYSTAGGNLGSKAAPVLAYCLLAPSYVIAYLGIGLLVIRFLRRFTASTLFVAVLVQVVLVTAGTAGPFVVASIFNAEPFGGYSLLQITNPFWSSMHVTEGSGLPLEAPALLTFVPLTALVVFVFNLPAILREVRHVRIAKPTRVAEEDRELAEQARPSEPVQISPWDVGPANRS